MAFEEIRIVGVDREGSVPLENGAAQVRYVLSHEPPAEWVRAFMDEIRGADFASVGEVSVLGDAMVTEPRIADLQRHTDALKGHVADANARYARRFHRGDEARAELDAALSALRI